MSTAYPKVAFVAFHDDMARVYHMDMGVLEYVDSVHRDILQPFLSAHGFNRAAEFIPHVYSVYDVPSEASA